MEVIKLVLAPFENNTYLVSGDGRGAAVVDPADGAEEIRGALAGAGWTAEAVLLTHGHFDHYGAVRALKEAGAAVYMNFADVGFIGQDYGRGLAVFTPDKDIADGQVIEVAGLKIEVIHTPGHTIGGVCYRVGDALFSGDTLFCGDVGRTDLPTGDFDTLSQSIRQKLYALPPETKVYPGHGEETTIGREKKHNRHVRG